mmetsp:Transcript_38106/g.88689  ORF Transcript_38106/g.88689 Transcript_38106/m.88689 type:complete len:116 (-) Transcript_38106:1140-1487(-)
MGYGMQNYQICVYFPRKNMKVVKALKWDPCGHICVGKEMDSRVHFGNKGKAHWHIAGKRADSSQYNHSYLQNPLTANGPSSALILIRSIGVCYWGRRAPECIFPLHTHAKKTFSP